MTEQTIHDTGAAKPVWFSMIGGGVAWAFHLTATYATGEWGCASRFGESRILGVTVPAWILVGWTLLSLAACLWAAFAGLRAELELRRREKERNPIHDRRHPGIYIGRAGFITSLLFALIIAAQGVPIFFFLNHC
jgi:hypothetical protein